MKSLDGDNTVKECLLSNGVLMSCFELSDDLARVCLSNRYSAVLLLETLLLYCQRDFTFRRLNAKNSWFYTHTYLSCGFYRPLKQNLLSFIIMSTVLL